jgi:hypothetical protein
MMVSVECCADEMLETVYLRSPVQQDVLKATQGPDRQPN